MSAPTPDFLPPAGVLTSWLPLAPILTPMGFGLLALAPLRRPLKVGLLVGGALLTLLFSLLLVSATADGRVLVSLLGGWAAPFGIVMTADRLGAFMSVLGAVSGVFAAWFLAADEDRVRERHHSFALLLLLLTGVQLSFLTGDLFNLFVAFEVMLVASYALAVLGSTREQLREGFRYIVMNLVASALLVVACGLAYGALGTLNFAHLAQRSAELGPNTTVTAVSVLLLIVFAAKGALFPLGFWLPGTYPALPTASGAFFAAVLTKVGVYALLRVFVTVFQQDNALPQALLLTLGAVTMLYGALGAVSQREWRRILSFTVMGSVGYLAFGLGLGTPDALRATVAYLAVSVLVTLALFLIAGVAERASGTRSVRARGFLEFLPLLAACYLLCALTIAGLPPTGGYVAKFALVRAGLAQGSPLAVIAVVSALLSSLITLYAMLAIWRGFFWGKHPRGEPVRRVPLAQCLPAYLASAAVAALALGAGPLLSYAGQTSRELIDHGRYVRGVLGTEPVVIPAPPTSRDGPKEETD
ncbi:multicomponent Na+:H+ antiporter subunit D [Deinococcus reticulitermitis]|uniref:Multicomponent Na+:H+ antiporter subunit D n=1 Tax=Deinococcus reticulitermitis TaxID=856736 RepID=A0A1H6XD90_9DEIO|nr:proton-conducting transporter membrane subunit [Deinococcus reticulitermitis]SEJ27103.1 multicomponent Na+:H+ antiporter subunit D [Deinococcus reticulitermitis]